MTVPSSILSRIFHANTDTHALQKAIPQAGQVQLPLQVAHSSLNAVGRWAVQSSLLAMDITSPFAVKHCSQNCMHIKKNKKLWLCSSNLARSCSTSEELQNKINMSVFLINKTKLPHRYCFVKRNSLPLWPRLLEGTWRAACLPYESKMWDEGWKREGGKKNEQRTKIRCWNKARGPSVSAGH